MPLSCTGWRLLAGAAFLSAAGFAASAGDAPKRFDGVEISVGVQDASAIGSAAEAHARTWEQRTGARVHINRIPFIGLFAASMASLRAERARFDVLLHASGWTADFFPYLTELPAELRTDESFDDIHPTYRERLMTWNGKWIAYTIDGDLYSGYYRQDLFEDETHQRAFAQRYGYPLAAPETWEQYRDIAEFFTGRTAPDGTLLYGSAESFARGGQQFWDLFSRASAYTNHPDFPGAQFFDPDTMRAQIDNPGWLRAVQEYVDILRFSPPDARTYGIVEARAAFLAGRTAMILDWGDTALLAGQAAGAGIAGKVGYFMLPGSHEVFDARAWRWSRFDRPRRAPFLAFGGWMASVPRNSLQQEAAWDFVRWFASPENSLLDVVTAGSGVNPYRLSHFAHIDAWTEALSRPAASQYLGVVQSSLDSPNVALDLRLPGFHRYTEALEEALTGILAGEAPIAPTLREVARAWNAITDDLGRDRQLAIYRIAMGLSGPPSVPRPGTDKDQGELVIGFSQATTTEPWRLKFNQELRAEAARHPNLRLLVRDGEDRAEQQVADVAELIAARVDALLISPKVAISLTPIVSQAFNQGIPVFVLDRDLENDRYTQFIGGDNCEIGRAAGRYARALLGGSGQARGRVVEIRGGMGATPAQERQRGFLEIVAGEPGIEVIEPLRNGDWKQDLGYEVMVGVLAEHARIDLVYAHNDPMAFGAYLAARDAGREREIQFLGIDGMPDEGARWVADGVLVATFLYQTPGAEAIRQALRFLGGEAVEKRLILPTQTIDQDNVAEFSGSSP
ncbi:extracellular solute-binding protein [Thiocystis minor]|uniref:extracellular solute-binding protein n=1 Tax=Thiocystis minor TaxID=61597 RepID=UPI001911D5AC|nr:extracellular solute-binding protein [Thiocystis minor]